MNKHTSLLTTYHYCHPNTAQVLNSIYCYNRQNKNLSALLPDKVSPSSRIPPPEWTASHLYQIPCTANSTSTNILISVINTKAMSYSISHKIMVFLTKVPYRSINIVKKAVTAWLCGYQVSAYDMHQNFKWKLIFCFTSSITVSLWSRPDSWSERPINCQTFFLTKRVVLFIIWEKNLIFFIGCMLLL